MASSSSKSSENEEEIQGYPLHILEKDAEKFLCSICKLILRDPVQLTCGHRLCRYCSLKLVKSEHPKCLICVEEDGESEAEILNEDNILPDNGIKRDLGKLKAKCPYMKKGCKWTGPFNDIEKHLPECPGVIIACKDCGAKVNMFEMSKHKETNCFNPETLCRFGCGKKIGKNFEEHMKQNVVPHMLSIDKRLKDVETNSIGKNSSSSAYSTLSLEVEKLKQKVQQLEAGVPFKQSNNKSAASARQDQSSAGAESGSTSASGLNEGPSIAGNLEIYEGAIMVLNREIDRIINQLDKLDKETGTERNKTRELEKKVTELTLALEEKDKRIVELTQKVSGLEMTSYDGTFMWKITDFKNKRQQAKSGEIQSFYSPVFYTSRMGYKLCARIYLNGDGTGRGKFVSLFFVVLKGDYDALQKWPFAHKVTFMAIDQNNKDHVIDAFRPDSTSPSFQRPASNMNVASGCPLFLAHTKLDDPKHGYVKEDTMFIKLMVETSG